MNEPSTEMCFNGHPVAIKPGNGEPWQCRQPGCQYYNGNPFIGKDAITPSVNDQEQKPSSLEELREKIVEIDCYFDLSDNQLNRIMDAIRSHMEAVTLDARIDELHLEADRFRESGHKGLPPGFQKRMNELQRAKSYLEGDKTNHE